MEHSHDFWLKSSHEGFDFDTADVPTIYDDPELSDFLKNTKSNKYNLLRYIGLDEEVETYLSGENLSRRIPDERYFKLTEKFNPLVISPKKSDKFESCVPEVTVKNMILGLEYSLSEYKSKKDKLDLLNAAEKTHDGSTILEVVLHLKNTFKKSTFYREIMAFPHAFNVYLAYLEENRETDEQSNMLLLANKGEDAAIQIYETVFVIEDAESKLHRIETCLNTHFQMISTDSLIQFAIEEHYRILKEQIEFLKSNLDCSVDETQMTHFENLTGKKSVIDSSVMCSLIYGCLFQYKSQENSHILTSPVKLVTIFNLTNKQFTWAIFRALASLQKWSEVDNLFLGKDWLGRLKIISSISTSRILDELFRAKAPTEVITKYVSCVENGAARLKDVLAFNRD